MPSVWLITPNNDMLDEKLIGGNRDRDRLEWSRNDILATWVLVRAEGLMCGHTLGPTLTSESLVNTWFRKWLHWNDICRVRNWLLGPLLGLVMCLISHAQPLQTWGKPLRSQDGQCSPWVMADEPFAKAATSSPASLTGDLAPWCNVDCLVCM